MFYLTEKKSNCKIVFQNKIYKIVINQPVGKDNLKKIGLIYIPCSVLYLFENLVNA